MCRGGEGSERDERWLSESLPGNRERLSWSVVVLQLSQLYIELGVSLQVDNAIIIHLYFTLISHLTLRSAIS